MDKTGPSFAMISFSVLVTVLSSLLSVGITYCQDLGCPESCPAPCTCVTDDPETGGVSVSCVNVIQPNFLAGCVWENVTLLSVVDGQLIKLTNEDLKDGVNLTSISITDTLLSQIEKESFSSLGKLASLILANNKLIDLPDELFKNSTFTRLDLSGNMLTTIGPRTLVGVEKMRMLSLARNNISDISRDSFSFASSLQTLDISSNRLATIEPGVLNGPDGVITLDLSHNSITSVDEVALIQGYDSLEVLHLEKNKLTDLVLPFTMTVIREVYLSHNEFRRVPQGVFESISSTQLTKLDLASNPITRVVKNTFWIPSTQPLEVLIMTDMPELIDIEDCGFCGLNSIKHLHVARCPNLTSFNPDVMPQEAYNLETLDISNNSISSFSNELFTPYISSLKSADILGNPLNCTCEASWIRLTMDDPESYSWVTPWIEELQCHSPQNLADRYVYSMNVYDLTCELPLVDYTSKQEDDDQSVYQVTLSRGIPSTQWQIPNGSLVQPAPQTFNGLTREKDKNWIVAREYELENNSVVALLTINKPTSDSNGMYTLVASNAGGTLTVPFTSDRPPAERGITLWEIVSITVAAVLLVLIVLLMVTAYSYYKRGLAWQRLQSLADADAEQT